MQQPSQQQPFISDCSFHWINVIMLLIDMKNTYKVFSAALYCFTFALAVAIWVLNITLVVLLGVFGFLGFNNFAQISTSCNVVNQSYFARKYNSNSNQMVELCFVSSCIALLLSTIVSVTLLFCLVRLLKGKTVAFLKGLKVGLYLTISLLVLSVGVSAGYYSSFWIELPMCLLTTYNPTQVRAVSVVALIAAAFSILLWLLFSCHFFGRVSSEKYEDMSSSQTELNQRRYKYYEQTRKQPTVVYAKKSDKANQLNKLQETNQNLNSPPSKRNINYVYSKYPEYASERRRNLPLVETKRRLTNQQREPVYLRPRDTIFQSDEEAYREYQQQYLSRNQPRSLLGSYRLQERDFRGSDYYRSLGPPPRRFAPTRIGDNQGVMPSYIRGRYAI